MPAALIDELMAVITDPNVTLPDDRFLEMSAANVDGAREVLKAGDWPTALRWAATAPDPHLLRRVLAAMGEPPMALAPREYGSILGICCQLDHPEHALTLLAGVPCRKRLENVVDDAANEFYDEPKPWALWGVLMAVDREMETPTLPDGLLEALEEGGGAARRFLASFRRAYAELPPGVRSRDVFMRLVEEHGGLARFTDAQLVRLVKALKAAVDRNEAEWFKPDTLKAPFRNTVKSF